MSCMSKILASFVYAFATEDWVFYLGKLFFNKNSTKIIINYLFSLIDFICDILIAPLVEIVNGTSFIAMRSIASKLVPTDELGKKFFLFPPKKNK